jgi:hydroxyacylglutathione hydrolase
MILKSLETGPLLVNTFIVGDEKTKEAAVIDPGGDVDRILMVLAENQLKCIFIINTHTHFDHIGGNVELKNVTGAPLVTHPDEVSGLARSEEAARLFGYDIPSSGSPDRLVRAGDVIKVGSLSLRVVEIRGHSPCGIALILDDQKIAFVGDSLFAGSIGRTDFAGGNMGFLLSDVRDNLFTLPDDTVVYPGHGPATSIGREKKFNPFF